MPPLSPGERTPPSPNHPILTPSQSTRHWTGTLRATDGESELISRVLAEVHPGGGPFVSLWKGPCIEGVNRKCASYSNTAKLCHRGVVTHLGLALRLFLL